MNKMGALREEIMAKLAGKVALITGAAGGQGVADAELMVREGAAVMLTDIAVAGGQRPGPGFPVARGHRPAVRRAPLKTRCGALAGSTIGEPDRHRPSAGGRFTSRGFRPCLPQTDLSEREQRDDSGGGNSPCRLSDGDGPY